MLSYEGVIRKRLRIKGHPEIPPYERGEEKATIFASADIEPDAPQSEARPADERAVDADEAQYDDVDEVEPAVGNLADVIGVQEVKDKRTEAQKQHDEILQKRETELLRKAATKSHKEQVEGFNKKLAKEPEHYDLFKTSFTK
ncbi:FAM32A-like [Chondrus crispus]|uniref:FAM32A-like n=1 Tax=Chondrus crispus TaxID=2769 RepID=R7QB07_CHOCR|nr:FAM32A-like [Chondrus crispus]CDF35697.1 FAM32A-like [Chondrus crispus]|eukprot:XP_005715516.1 FAM32A-like [Chondrus crispus]